MHRREFLALASMGILAGCAEGTNNADDASSPTPPSTDAPTPARGLITISDVELRDAIDYNSQVNATIEVQNEGGQRITESVVVEFDSVTVDTVDLTLDAGEVEAFTVIIDASGLDSGERLLVVSTTTDIATKFVTINDPVPAHFDVEIVQVPLVIDHDKPFNVRISVRNTGDVAAEQELVLTVDGDEYAATLIELEGGQSETVEISIGELGLFSGDYPLQVASPGDNALTEIVVDHPNPYNRLNLVVGLEQEVAARQDIHAIIEEALAYWDENAETYAGYSIEYDYTPNATNPDILIRVVEDILACGLHTGEIMGCAPLVTQTPSDIVEIRIVTGYRSEWLVTTLKHELGHTLGLTHDDEPAHIMSNEAEDLIPNYIERLAALDAYDDGIWLWNDGVIAWNEATQHLDNGEDSDAEVWASEARTSFFTSASDFEDVRNIGERLDESDAASLAEESRLRADYMGQAATSLRDAARAYQRGAIRTGNRHVNDANVLRETSLQYEIATSSDVYRAFGFPVRD